MDDQKKERLLNLLLEPEPGPGAPQATGQSDDQFARPLTPEMEDRLVAAAAARAKGRGAASVIPHRGAPWWRRSRFTPAISVAAMAAAVAIIFQLVPGTPGFAPMVPYRASLMVSNSLGEPAAPPAGEKHAGVKSEITLDVQPVKGEAGPVEVRAFLSGAGRFEPWALEWEKYKTGRMTWTAAIRDRPELSAGRWNIVIVVGRPGRIPPEREVESLARDGKNVEKDDFYILVESLTVD